VMRALGSISPTQSKAARTYLSWTQEVLAKAAGVGRSTICTFEDGEGIRRDSVAKIREAFEKHGIEFIEGDGVKRRDLSGIIYRGQEVFYNDMLETAKEHGGDVYCIVKSQELLIQIFGDPYAEDFDRLNTLAKKASMKCLVTQAQALSVDLPSIQFRKAFTRPLSPYSYFGYGNKYAHVVQEGRGEFIFAVFNLIHVAHDYRSSFLSAWELAEPIRVQPQSTPKDHGKVFIGA
ncbi:MAG: hypothetical protein PHD48_11070, partial [Alphaproteobacteria bacterium]|nr:hypothetical protein [Alphaproteobacteria bacterium]